MNQPNKPQNTDSLHVGETVELGLTQMEISESVDKMADRYASWFGVYNDPEWNKLRLAYLAGERLGRLKQQLSEAGESKWIDVKNILPEVAGFYWVNRIVVNTHTDDHGNDQFINEKEKIFYFKERNVTGWEKDWTGNPSNVTHWQPLPSAPNETNVEPRLYTHADLLAFGEKVKELAAEKAIELSTIDSILSIDLNKIEIK